ncbi:MAG: hypothetical protein ABR574_01255 [Cryomorphaceae bacterium]|nr:hypothetical protein [Flavobacteriales bacterium]
MIRAFIAFLLLCTAAPAYAQWKEVYRIKDSADFIAFDNLFNLYRVKGSELFKYNSDGELQFRYSDKQIGDINTIDVTYPMRPLLTYPDLNYVVILDNTLSNNRGRKNMLDYGISLATLATNSVQNHFWFYDGMNFSVSRFNENFRPISRTGNLAQVLGIELDPVAMTEFGNRLYINNPSSGIMVFDIYGTYLKTIPLKNIDTFQVFENEIAYCKDGKLLMYNTLLFKTEEISIPVPCRAAYIQKNRVALLTDEGILVLKNSNP